MPKTAAKRRADFKFNKKTYERIYIEVRKDTPINANAIRDHAAMMGESINGFMKRAVEEAIQRDRDLVFDWQY